MDKKTQGWTDGWTAGGELHVWTEGHGWMDRRTAGGELDVWRERHGWTDGWMAGGEVDIRTEGHRGGQTRWVQSSNSDKSFWSTSSAHCIQNRTGGGAPWSPVFPRGTEAQRDTALLSASTAEAFPAHVGRLPWLLQDR